MNSKRTEIISNIPTNKLSPEAPWYVYQDASGFWLYEYAIATDNPDHNIKYNKNNIINYYGYYKNKKDAHTVCDELNSHLTKYVKDCNFNYLCYKNQNNEWNILYAPLPYFFLPESEKVIDVFYADSENKAKEKLEILRKQEESKAQKAEESTSKKPYLSQILHILKAQHFSDEQILKIQLECENYKKENDKTSIQKAAENFIESYHDTNSLQSFKAGAKYTILIWKDISKDADGAMDAISRFDNWCSANDKD